MYVEPETKKEKKLNETETSLNSRLDSEDKKKNR